MNRTDGWVGGSDVVAGVVDRDYRDDEASERDPADLGRRGPILPSR